MHLKIEFDFSPSLTWLIFSFSGLGLIDSRLVYTSELGSVVKIDMYEIEYMM